MLWICDMAGSKAALCSLDAALWVLLSLSAVPRSVYCRGLSQSSGTGAGLELVSRRREGTDCPFSMSPGLHDGVRSSSNSRSGSHDRHDDHTDTSDSESLSLQVRRINQQPQVRKPGERGYDPNR